MNILVLCYCQQAGHAVGSAVMPEPKGFSPFLSMRSHHFLVEWNNGHAQQSSTLLSTSRSTDFTLFEQTYRKLFFHKSQLLLQLILLAGCHPLVSLMFHRAVLQSFCPFFSPIRRHLNLCEVGQCITGFLFLFLPEADARWCYVTSKLYKSN